MKAMADMLQKDATKGVHVTLQDLIDTRYRLKELQFSSSNNKRSPLVGMHQSKIRGRGIDFDQVRIYLPGDDIRTIDWRVTAKTQRAHTKIFHEEKERPVFLLVEQTHQLFLGTGNSLKSVVAAELASFLSWAVLQNNDRVGGLVFNESQHKAVLPRLSKRSVLQLLNYLHQFNQQLSNEQTVSNTTESALLSALKQAQKTLRPGSLLLVIVDERSLDPNCYQILQYLAMRLDIVLFPVYDPLDRELPDVGLVRFAQANQELMIDTSNPYLRQAYQAQAQQRQLTWQQLSRSIRARLLPINAQQDSIQQLNTLLNTKKH